MDVIVYTKRDCERCKTFKSFLIRNNLAFVEKDIDTDEVVQELSESSFIIENFCDEEQCIVITPIIKIEGMWMYKEFFDEEGNFKKAEAERIFKLKKLNMSS